MVLLIMGAINEKINEICRIIINKLSDNLLILDEKECLEEFKKYNIAISTLEKILKILGNVSCDNDEVDLNELNKDDIDEIISFYDNNIKNKSFKNI